MMESVTERSHYDFREQPRKVCAIYFRQPPRDGIPPFLGSKICEQAPRSVSLGPLVYPDRMIAQDHGRCGKVKNPGDGSPVHVPVYADRIERPNDGSAPRSRGYLSDYVETRWSVLDSAREVARGNFFGHVRSSCGMLPIDQRVVFDNAAGKYVDPAEDPEVVLRSTSMMPEEIRRIINRYSGSVEGEFYKIESARVPGKEVTGIKPLARFEVLEEELPVPQKPEDVRIARITEQIRASQIDPDTLAAAIGKAMAQAQEQKRPSAKASK